jgi:hypothetical protein
MSGDFFDEDLTRPGATSREKDPAAEAGAERGDPEGGRLTRHREDTSHRVAGAMRDLEMLRRKQEALAKEKDQIEDLARKQEAYERGKREMVDALAASTVSVEKEEVQAVRLAELLGTTRASFADALAELKAINEDTWPDATFEEELNRALAVVENARALYKKSVARIEAAGASRAAAPEALTSSGSDGGERRRGFGYWLMVGVAVSLPGAVLAVALFVAWLFLSGLI